MNAFKSFKTNTIINYEAWKQMVEKVEQNIEIHIEICENVIMIVILHNNAEDKYLPLDQNISCLAYVSGKFKA